jgi:hypothetical protein
LAANSNLLSQACVEAKVNHSVFKKTRPLLEKYVLRPVIGAAVDLGINVLRQKFPELRL